MKFFLNYLSLMALLALTILFYSTGIYVTLLIASVKASLILYYFMKLNEASRSLKIIALGSIFWILILLGLTASDYLTRS